MDLDVDALPDQRQRGGEPADAAADDCNLVRHPSAIPPDPACAGRLRLTTLASNKTTDPGRETRTCFASVRPCSRQSCWLWPARVSPRPLSARTYPTKPIKLIVPFGAGGPVDVMGRLVAQKLSASGRRHGGREPPRPGRHARRAQRWPMAEPDGYTLMVATSTTMGVSANLYKNLDFDPVKSFAPVALISSVPFVLVVRPSLPIRTDAGADRLRPGQSRQAQLRLPDRHAAASDRRAVPAAHRHRRRLHPLQGRQQRRHRPGRRPDRLRLRARVGADRPHQRRQGAPARGDEPHPPSANSGRSDARRRRRRRTSSRSPGAAWSRPQARPRRSLKSSTRRSTPSSRPATCVKPCCGSAPRSRPGTPADFATFIAEEAPKWAEVVKSSGMKLE